LNILPSIYLISVPLKYLHPFRTIHCCERKSWWIETKERI